VHRGINELGFNEDNTKHGSHLNSLLSLLALLSTLFCYIFSLCVVVVLIQRTHAQKYFAMLDRNKRHCLSTRGGFKNSNELYFGQQQSQRTPRILHKSIVYYGYHTETLRERERGDNMPAPVAEEQKCLSQHASWHFPVQF
jgi:hypothetical protein